MLGDSGISSTTASESATLLAVNVIGVSSASEWDFLLEAFASEAASFSLPGK